MKITLEQFAAKRARLAAEFMPAVRRGLLSGANRAISLMQQATVEAPPANPNGIGTGGAFNKGDYRRGWKAERIPNGVRVYNAMNYSGVIEYGRRPGRFPPRAALVNWIQRKLSPRNMRGKAAQNWAEKAYYPIARAIARRGLRGRLVLTNRVLQIRRLITEEIGHELDVALKGTP